MSLTRRSLALVLTLQVSSAWALPAGVLCVADDGHLALKVVESACSHPGGHSHADEHSHGESHDHGDGHSHAHDHAHAPAPLDLEEHGCHPCVDVELLEEPPVQQSSDEQGLAAPPLVAAHPAANLLPPAPAPPQRSAKPPAVPPLSLRALRTIVLTC